jgi:hypothetical protein
MPRPSPRAPRTFAFDVILTVLIGAAYSRCRPALSSSLVRWPPRDFSPEFFRRDLSHAAPKSPLSSRKQAQDALPRSASICNYLQ